MDASLFDPVEYAKQCIREKVESSISENIMFATIDMKQLVLITNHSDSYLRQNFICTPEAKALSCSPTTKELWRYPEIRDCWLEFCDRNKRGK
ncbi:hypothetical protein [Enterococcus gallinarum]|jgi:hypothetical protein|uniref:Uncharacterized protein n=1 Tax=Enterococcus gallinarum TaxID=1353 RepID=A0ABD4ZYA5_ENTGA|nr:hypothetical protein [Enterococcus gallinarum]MBX8978963.1 hypothetical protein [Enterococcus gallinarum]MDL4876140.1 hypothetical protein [Enterococcus gallinarum]MDL4921718.1 hypothetical protein [Enterococcus gallinarum]MDL4937636.1 hypothetical protein [Enterococcus gallinarum]MDL4983424.1 hypothetical protein [Enterococcus gallinarum]